MRQTPPAAPRSSETTAWALASFLVVAGALVALSVFAYRRFGPAVVRVTVIQGPPPAGASWLGAFSWWDGWWYTTIAEGGYSYRPGQQSSVAFFPVYPLLMRVGGMAGIPTVLAGFAITLAAGAASAVLFLHWCRTRLTPRRAGVALAVLLLYPCSFYLAGTVYADALFVALVIGAFMLLERGRPWMAGLVGAVATATRPIGIALVVGLWLRGTELGRGAGHGRAGGRPWGVLLAPTGLVLYCAYLGVRFGDPLAFVAVEAAPGWGQAPGWATWLKLAWFEGMASRPYLNALHFHLVGHAVATVIFLALIPGVHRRFGRAYALFALLVVAGSALSTRNFIGMGRYVLSAFPCFAVAGDLLADRPRLARAVLPASAGLLAIVTTFHARNMLIS